jgi:importin subunit alpha-1
LNHICDSQEERIAAIVEAGSVRRMVEMMDHNEANVKSAALKLVGSICTGTDVQTQSAISRGGLPILKTLLNDLEKNVRKQVCWILSNIAAGNEEKVKIMIAAKIFPSVRPCLVPEDEEVQVEAAWIVHGAANSRNAEFITHLFEEGLIESLCNFLDCSHKAFEVALFTLENVSKVDNLRKKLSVELETIAAKGKLEQIQQESVNDNGIVSRIQELIMQSLSQQKASKIITLSIQAITFQIRTQIEYQANILHQ